MESKIILVYGDSNEARAVSEAVSPDNVRTPENLSVKTFSMENRVVTLVKYDGKNLMTFTSTIDDLLSCVSVAEKTFSTVKKLKCFNIVIVSTVS